MAPGQAAGGVEPVNEDPNPDIEDTISVPLPEPRRIRTRRPASTPVTRITATTTPTMAIVVYCRLR